MANLIYILYIVGFFTGITALVGVIMAYVNRDTASDVFKSHLNFQIKVFWRGVIFAVVNTVVYVLVGVISAVTMGLGAILTIIPIGIGIWWLVWTIMAIAKGMGALGRSEPMPA
ncbi:hypothetical protein E6C67_04180 (plasmid) [Azospirillum sp. TSA2s]|uniref:hypothetical protein n=1 Tax=Azospirillum sp. TSA2s TaxID=709810 RepID=UPI0010AA7A9C|nr:hypothetical protein [Azospirillum sp. TSA2s]QCG93145.1 hypothetical protein E6C67_04180 [Azospirillum sp. TSA2s]